MFLEILGNRFRKFPESFLEISSNYGIKFRISYDPYALHCKCLSAVESNHYIHAGRPGSLGSNLSFALRKSNSACSQALNNLISLSTITSKKITTLPLEPNLHCPSCSCKCSKQKMWCNTRNELITLLKKRMIENRFLILT